MLSHLDGLLSMDFGVWMHWRTTGKGAWTKSYPDSGGQDLPICPHWPSLCLAKLHAAQLTSTPPPQNRTFTMATTKSTKGKASANKGAFLPISTFRMPNDLCNIYLALKPRRTQKPRQRRRPRSRVPTRIRNARPVTPSPSTDQKPSDCPVSLSTPASLSPMHPVWISSGRLCRAYYYPFSLPNRDLTSVTAGP